MKKQYFLKDKKARIYKTVYLDDHEGYMQKPHFIPRTPSDLWCYTSQLSQTLVFVAKTFSTDETRMFVFNSGVVAETYDLILYRSQWYQVTRVDTTDDYNGEVFVYVEDCPKGKIPSQEFIHDCGWIPPTS